MNIDILAISELMTHYIFYCGQESLRGNGVALRVNRRVRNAALGCVLKNERMISVRFQGKPFNITVIQVYAPTSNAECIMRNAGLEETQAGIKIAGRNINNFRYADGTTLMTEVKKN